MNTTMVRRALTLAFIVGLLTATAYAQERKLTRAQLPPAVEKTVAAESQGATIKKFTTEVEKGKRLYEAEFEINGHSKGISMDKNGNIVEVEEEVTMDSLPAVVQDALKKRAGAGTIGKIESLSKDGNVVAYLTHVKIGAKVEKFRLGPNGEKLARPE